MQQQGSSNLREDPHSMARGASYWRARRWFLRQWDPVGRVGDVTETVTITLIGQVVTISAHRRDWK
jgi:hypothetical protein